MQRQWMKDLRERSPRVHCITNYVTAGDVANMVLAAGGSPVMAQGLHEVEDVTSICSSLVLNLGTLEERTIPAMEAAGRKAAGLGLPVILDPVGVTASRFRRQTAIDIIRKTSPSVIRGNEAEIRALNQELRGHEAGNTCGVDSETFGTIESRMETAFPEGPYRRGCGYDRGRRCGGRKRKKVHCQKRPSLDGQDYRQRLYAGRAYGSVLRSVWGTGTGRSDRGGCGHGSQRTRALRRTGGRRDCKAGRRDRHIPHVSAG